MKTYYRVMLGGKSIYADECRKDNFIGADYGIHEDLTGKLPDSWRDFNSQYIPVYLANRPEKKKIAAGLACGMLYTISKAMQIGDIVLCPDGTGIYHVGEIAGNYYYAPNKILPHRRTVKWLETKIRRNDCSPGLQNTTGATGTVCNISRAGYAEEVEKLLSGNKPPVIVVADVTVEDPYGFAMEKHLEDFLVMNWKQTELGKNYDIYEEEGEQVGQQYETDTGPLDILAIRKDQKELLVVELKRGRASDVVVGQTLRYMGYVQEELAEDHQKVAGAIIALEDDQKMRLALKMTPSISFYKYQVSFKLVKH